MQPEQTDAAPVVRRDYILRNLSTSRWTELSPAELAEALAEPVILGLRRMAHEDQSVRRFSGPA